MANDDVRGIGETHTNLAIRMVTVEGDVAGPIAIEGWIPGSSLKSVVALEFDTDAIATMDLTSEFSETDDGIDNTDGTDTSGAVLLVLFIAAHPKGGSLTRS